MIGKTIEYKSVNRSLDSTFKNIETNTNKGITCTWSGQVFDNNDSIKYSWQFNWDKLKKEGIEELTGYIITRRPLLTAAENVRIDVHLTNSVNTIETTIDNTKHYSEPCVAFEYYLTPIYIFQTEDIPYEVMFMASEQTDAILVVDGKKLHVNKAFLSFHSDYFRALFSSNFKEGTMDVIPIGDVTYEDFCCLLSMVYPQNSAPTDETVEKLLELADRFMMQSVTRQVERYLLNYSGINNEKLMWLADKYSMPTLLKKTIHEMNSKEKAKQMRESPEYKELSAETKAALFERLVMLV